MRPLNGTCVQYWQERTLELEWKWLLTFLMLITMMCLVLLRLKRGVAYGRSSVCDAFAWPQHTRYTTQDNDCRLQTGGVRPRCLQMKAQWRLRPRQPAFLRLPVTGMGFSASVFGLPPTCLALPLDYLMLLMRMTIFVVGDVRGRDDDVFGDVFWFRVLGSSGGKLHCSKSMDGNVFAQSVRFKIISDVSQWLHRS